MEIDQVERDRLSIKRDALLYKKRILDAIELLREKGPVEKKDFVTSYGYLSQAAKIHKEYHLQNLIASLEESGVITFIPGNGSYWLTKEVAAKINDGFDKFVNSVRNEYHAINEKLRNPSLKKGGGKVVDDKPHATYWKYVLRIILSLVIARKRFLLIAFATIIVGFILFSLGYAIKYRAEFSTWFGTLEVIGPKEEALTETPPESSLDPESKLLDRSIFDLAEAMRPGVLTSQQRVNSIAEIAGLETKKEVGVIEDIGVGGLTLLIRGVSKDGRTGHIQCDFSQDWKQRLSLLKNSLEIKFMGVISNYNLSQEWIVLNHCELQD